MKKAKLLQLSFWGIGSLVLLFSYVNCGEGFVALKLADDMRMFSRAPGETCEQALVRVYAQTFQPFLIQSCNACHVNGPGIGSFSSNDVMTSYTSFASIGVEKISAQALNPNHKPPFTGPTNATKVNDAKTYWAGAQEGYASCLASEGGGGSSKYQVISASKVVPSNISTTFQRMEWDLEKESPSGLPLIAGIDIRRFDSSGTPKGYEFRNPTLRLKSGVSGSYNARALYLNINEVQNTEITTYANIDKDITSSTDLNLSPGTANAVTVMTIAATDKVAMNFMSLKSGSGNGGSNPAPAPAPSPGPNPGGTVTFTQLTSASGVFTTACISCHSNTRALGGLNLQNYTAAKNAAQNIKTRVTNAANPMPTAGLLPKAQQDMMTSWVDGGAPQ